LIYFFRSLNVKRLNILHWKCTTADKFSFTFSSNGFQPTVLTVALLVQCCVCLSVVCL